ncbi:hypothetical protein [Pedobacter nyackensis]|uniref:MetA-pathway of phenol degradation n=1 Tax=Pedobacter nyackensis TaxID=475255 RepID=A0A1W2F562_9SPHI|nr:hypothetical protein [Pedobacter nyackensis]SMD16656.1 hypothetical protein SAMN04488101_12060 [Pedobacter nyackensis]
MRFLKFLLVPVAVAMSAITMQAQELYVFSEPASNMAAKSIGFRLTNEGVFSPNFSSRLIPELMLGFNKNFMLHGQGFFSDMDGKYKAEGAGLYGKYRFLSIDEVKSHFRAAAFARVGTSNRPTYSEDINLEGDNTGVQAGLVFTQLLHKLALSSTLSYSKAFDNIGDKTITGTPQPDHMLGYSMSSGYLLLPFVYKNYNQPNLNLYFEVLGKTNPENGRSYVDFAPAVQVIINSRTRVDLGYRFEVAGNLENRYNKNMYMARVEFNFFNALK